MKMEKVNEIATATLQTIIENFRVSESIGAEISKEYAKIAGGAQIFKHMTMDMLRIGDRNVESVRAVLRDSGIRIVSEDVGGEQGRTVYFYTTDGRMLIRYSRGGELWI